MSNEQINPDLQQVADSTEAQIRQEVGAQRQDALGKTLGGNALVTLSNGAIVPRELVVRERSAGHDMSGVVSARR